MSTVHKATIEDIPEINDVHYRTWLATYPSFVPAATPERIRYRFEEENGGLQGRAERWRETITSTKDKVVYVAKQANKVVGFSLAEVKEDHTGHIASFYVLPEVQGQGVGSQLMRQSLKWLQADQEPVVLEVGVGNDRAFNFYEKHGFKFTRELPDELRDHGYNDIIIPQNEMVRAQAPIA